MANPMARVEQVPSPGESDHGLALDAEGLRKLIAGFREPVLFPIVATAALTGARRNEILALRWSDFDAVNRTLRIERALEETKEAGVTFKPPKTKRGTRTITIDDDLAALLIAEREKHLRIVAGFRRPQPLICRWSGCPRGRSCSRHRPVPDLTSPDRVIRTPSPGALSGTPADSASRACASTI